MIMEITMRRQRIFGTFLVAICSVYNIILTDELNFNDICRFEGICLNCSEGGCDDMCHFYENFCCDNSSATNIVLEKWQYSCVRKFPDMYDLHLDCRGSFDGVYGVYMVTKCSDLWIDDLIKAKCEQSSENDLLSEIPVYDHVHEIVTYKNMYCAFCNNLKLDHLKFWTFDLMCNEIQTSGDEYENCFIRLRYKKHRMCAMGVIESCNDTTHVTPSLTDKCENGLSQNVYVWERRHKYRVYKNEFCAQCNFEAGVLQCWAFQAFTCWPEDLPPYKNVKAMMNLKLYEHDDMDSVELLHKSCEEGVLFDPFRKTCLNVTCLSLHNICISGKCHLIELEASEFAIQNDSSLYVFALDEYIKDGRYFIKKINVGVCLDDRQYFKIKETITLTKRSEITTVVVSKGIISSDLPTRRVTLLLLTLLFTICV